jgi:hypothetical protein
MQRPQAVERGERTTRPLYRAQSVFGDLTTNRWIFTGLFLALLGGVYTNLPLSIGVQIVGGYAIIPGIAFLAIHWRDLVRRVPLLIALFACPLLPTMINFRSGLDVLQGMESYVGLVASVIGALGLFLAIRKQDRNYLSTLLLALGCIVMLLLILEVYTGFKAVSDEVRKVLYEGRFVYEGNVRDLAEFGHVRPKAFAQEPSGPARFMAYTLAGAVALGNKRWQWALAAALFIASKFVISSPSLYAALMVVVLMLAIRLGLYWKFNRQLLNVGAVALAVVIAVGATDVNTLSKALGSARAEKIEKGTETSTQMRMLIPPQIFLTSVKEKGLLGAGMGSKLSLQTMVDPIFEAQPGSQGMKDTDGHWDWANAFFDVLINMGPILGITFLALLPFIFNNPLPGTSLVLFEAVFMLDSGLPGARNWAYFGLITACFTVYLSSHISASIARSRQVPPKPTRRVRKQAQPA